MTLDILDLIHEKNHCQSMMRHEKDAQKKAEYKRRFRRARNALNLVREGR